MQKNFTVLPLKAFDEVARQLSDASQQLTDVKKQLEEAKKTELEVPHLANCAEALRRIGVFASGCQQALKDASLKDHLP